MATRKKAAKKKTATKRKTVAKKRTATKKKSNAGTAKLKKITTEAKKIYKGGKAGISWQTAIKRAAKKV